MGPQKQGFWSKINCSQMKLPNFVSPSGDSWSKSANFGLSKNLSELFFSLENNCLWAHICKNDLLITSIFEPLHY